MALKTLFPVVIFLALSLHNLDVVVCPKRPGEFGEPSSSRQPKTQRTSQFQAQPSRSTDDDWGYLWVKYNRVYDYILKAIDSDSCKCNSFKGNEDCKKSLEVFLRVPATMRGFKCRNPMHAQCYAPEESDDVRQCHFFVESPPEETDLAAAKWVPLAVCFEDLPHFNAPIFRSS